ncbi:MAG: metallophosphoesterase family protein [Verrucomicrobiia bacterium]
MKTTFIHTADWQLGKPFASVNDPHKRSLLQAERIAVINRIAETAREHKAEFVLIAGDLFDSPGAIKSTVSAACSAIGALGVPVYAIPGNHDHGGAGGLWEQEFFLREREQLAPNFHILLKPEPVELDNAVLLPCPLLRRHDLDDPTTWIREGLADAKRFGNKPRIILAHGSIATFGSLSDDDDDESGADAVNHIDLDRLPETELDYLALGDWHGTKQVGAKAWYSGTPELDRFIKGGQHDPGNILIVEAERGQPPKVARHTSARLGWHELAFSFADDTGLDALEQQVSELIEARANEDLLRLTLDGALGIEAFTRLENALDSWIARLIRLKLENHTTIEPTPEELESLTQRAQDPLVSRVAARLTEMASTEGEDGAVARVALRELHAACNAN